MSCLKLWTRSELNQCDIWSKFLIGLLTKKQSKNKAKSSSLNSGLLPLTNQICCNSIWSLAMALPFHAEGLQIGEKYLRSEIGQIWHSVGQLTSILVLKHKFTARRIYNLACNKNLTQETDFWGIQRWKLLASKIWHIRVWQFVYTGSWTQMYSLERISANLNWNIQFAIKLNHFA